eukprot:15440643-Alexandrium_andersonii.AAC.1
MARRPVGPSGTAASSIWNARPFSMLASVLFGYFVSPTCENCKLLFNSILWRSGLLGRALSLSLHPDTEVFVSGWAHYI